MEAALRPSNGAVISEYTRRISRMTFSV